MLEPDGIPTFQLIADLRAVRLPESGRAFVLRCDRVLKDRGAVPEADVTRLRGLFRTHRKRLQELYDARERGRDTALKRETGMTDRDIVHARQEHLDLLDRKVNDFGL